MTHFVFRSTVLRLSLIALLAVLIHGYHLGVDDSAIYVPAIKHAADPALYPFGSEFFMTHAHLSVFSDLVGGSQRLIPLPIDGLIFAWHAACVFLLLLAAWQLLCACFEGQAARWSGIALLAGALSVPVAGTALVIMDPYLTARSLSTPLTLFAVAAYVSGKPKQAFLWLFFTALVHPQMAVYGVVFLGSLWLTGHFRIPEVRTAAPAVTYLAALPFLFELQPARGPAREALLSRTYFFVSNWAWYEWLGVLAPLGMAWWLSSRKPRGTMPAFGAVLRTLPPFGALFTIVGVLLASSPKLENFTRLQPMRSLHIVYVIFFLMLGGLLGEYVLRKDVRRWAVVFVPLAIAMFFLQQSQFPNSAHVEWPGYHYHNNWNSAFSWIRTHTPKDAVFALDPNYMVLAGEDQHGFRAETERSVLADAVKDSGAVSLFPALAGEWKNEVAAQTGLEHFSRSDLEHLATLYPVTWIVTWSPGPTGFACPYQNEELAVCRLSTAAPITSRLSMH